MADPVTVEDLESLKKMAAVYYRDYPGRLARVFGELDRLAASLRQVVILRPNGSAWEIGRPGASRVYCGAPKTLRAVHAVLSGRVAVKASDYVAGVFQDNALRNALRSRVAPWVDKCTQCTPLAEAVRAIKISRGGTVSYSPKKVNGPRFITD